MSTKDGLKRYALSALDYIEKQTQCGSTCKIGLDTKFDVNGLHIISIDFGDAGSKVLVHSDGWGNTFEPCTKNILELDFLIVQFSIAADVHKLRNRFNIRIKRVRDFYRLCLHGDPNQETSAQALVSRCLGFYLDKNTTKSKLQCQAAFGHAIAALCDG